MITYITRSRLREFSSELPLNEQLKLRKSASSRSPAGATFLSHSSKDLEILPGVIRVLENHGASVYTDEIDPEMPSQTTEETARLLKKRIHESSRFVLLASENSQQSKWVPWELGVADGDKGLDRIALFPAVDTVNDTSWTSWEYLGLYRRIVWGDLEGRSKPVWMVLDEKRNTATVLEEWLQR